MALKLFFDKGRGYIIENHSETNDLTPGTEIVSINGQDVSSLVAELQSYLSTDGNNLSTKREIINQHFSLLLAIHEGFPSDYELSFRKQREDLVRTIKVGMINSPFYFNNQPKTEENLHFELDSIGNMATLTIKSFVFNNQFTQFKTFVDDSF